MKDEEKNGENGIDKTNQLLAIKEETEASNDYSEQNENMAKVSFQSRAKRRQSTQPKKLDPLQLNFPAEETESEENEHDVQIKEIQLEKSVSRAPSNKKSSVSIHSRVTRRKSSLRDVVDVSVKKKKKAVIVVEESEFSSSESKESSALARLKTLNQREANLVEDLLDDKA